MSVTRRTFLERLAGATSAGVAYDAMAALGWMATPAPSPRFELRGEVHGTRIIVLGAGLTGMAVAYELGKVGYDCRVLEARSRAGGRCLTVRRGTCSEENGSSEIAAFDDGLYFNAGPMRIPHHHRATLDYCRELQVPLEVFCIANENTFLCQTQGPLAGRRVRVREARADANGYVAELHSKAVAQQTLDYPLTSEDRECLLEFLRREGALDDHSAYRGSARRGYAISPGAGDHTGLVGDPIALGPLLQSRLGLYLQSEYVLQPTMFQVVGGTDRLANALAATLGSRVTFGAVARELRQTASGVSVAFSRADGSSAVTHGEYCISTLPLPILATLDGDLSTELRSAAAAVAYAAAGKIGLQFKRRFWEEDDGIFGGISRTDQEITQLVYPSHGFLTGKGVLLGYYHHGEPARAMGERPPAERLDAALGQGERLHPQYRREFETGFAVAWEHVPWTRGGWAQYTPEQRNTLYPALLRPDRRLHLAGDYLSYLSGWMCGAFESARLAASAVHAQAYEDAPRRSGAA